MNESQLAITILTIEDDPIVRKGIAFYLENSAGYHMLQAGDGQEGLEIFRRASPDLVLTDLRLPRLDGMEVLATIRKESPDTPVIIVSGMGTLDDTISALKLGARDYVTKPISDMALLAHAIERALERARLIKENKQYQDFLEQEVEKKTAELYQAQKLEAIGTLAGGIAHDFNNILSAIMGFTELALLKTKQSGEIEQYLLQIKKASNRARDLVLQILTFSRKSITKRAPIQAALIIKEALKLLRATLPATVELQENIKATQTMILADPTELHQVITNLCTNAFHALTNERGEISVRLDTVTFTEDQQAEDPEVPPGEFLRLVVRDNGCGMDKATANKIFDPFFTTKEKGSGTGLGLSVVHGIVKESSGVLRVESEPEKGSTFTILFPTVEPSSAQKVEAIISLPGGKEKILFVDDEETLRTLAQQMLSYLGYSVVCCSSGKDALQKIKDSSTGFDLVITDQSMPHMPGTELAEEIQTLCPGLPVILCTGYSSVVDKKVALTLGIKGFLLKPMAIHTLAKEIRGILD